MPGNDLRPPVLAPALEGSKPIIPQTAQLPLSHRPYDQGGRMAYYPNALPPIGGPRYMVPPDRFSVPSLLSRPRPRYSGPGSLMPYWGGYSVGPHYYPGWNRLKFQMFFSDVELSVM